MKQNTAENKGTLQTAVNRGKMNSEDDDIMKMSRSELELMERQLIPLLNNIRRQLGKSRIKFR